MVAVSDGSFCGEFEGSAAMMGVFEVSSGLVELFEVLRGRPRILSRL